MAKNSNGALDFTQRSPARRFGNPTEIVHAIVFLASDEAAFSVGSELVIDGGMSTL
jgi:NAD(P)-dependent dehydrogenase (short-subunit alcohol dehydrogenase family)